MKTLLALLLLIPSFAWSNARWEYIEAALGGAFNATAIIVVGFVGIFLWKLIKKIYHKLNEPPPPKNLFEKIFDWVLIYFFCLAITIIFNDELKEIPFMETIMGIIWLPLGGIIYVYMNFFSG